MDFRWHCFFNHYDNSTLNSSGLVDRCVFVLLLSLMLGGEQAAPRYRDGSGHGKSRVTAASSCREQRRDRPLCQLVSRQMPVGKGSVYRLGFLPSYGITPEDMAMRNATRCDTPI